MRKIPVITTVVFALAIGAIAPATVAHATDDTVSGIVTLPGGLQEAVEVGWYDPTTRLHAETLTVDGHYSLTVPTGTGYVVYAGINRDGDSWLNAGRDKYVGAFQGAAGGQSYIYQGLGTLTGSQVENFTLDLPGTIAGVSAGTNHVSVNNGGGFNIATADATETGAFSVSGLVPGTYYVIAEATDQETGRNWKSAAITVAPGATTTVTPDFSAAQTTGTLTGVIKSHGKPIKGIFVGVSSSRSGGSDTTNSKGRYTIRRLEPGSYSVSVGGTFDGSTTSAYIPKTKKKVTVTANGTKTANVSMIKGGMLSGFVARPSKASSFTVTVLDKKGRVLGASYDIFSKKKSTTAFSVNGLTRGVVSVIVTTDKTARYGSKTIKVGKSTAHVGTIVQSKKTITITGTVKSAQSGTVYYSLGRSAAENFLLGYGTFSDITKGKYKLTGVVPEWARLDVSASNTEYSEITTKLKKSGKKTLKTGTKYGVVTGTFLLGGLPLADGSVTFNTPSGAYLLTGSLSVTDGKGTGSFPSGHTEIASFDGTDLIDQFQPGPYYLALPSGFPAVKLKPGQKYDYGTVNLVIAGGTVQPA